MNWRRNKSWGSGRRLSQMGCCRRRTGCLVIIFLLILFIGSLLLLGVFSSRAKAADVGNPTAVWLLIDNSNSMYELGGMGSDPDELRFEAAKLFIAYLAEVAPAHQVGVILFGSEPALAAELTALNEVNARQKLTNQLESNEPLGWTNPLAAIELAQAQTPENGRSPILILLTDGKPELSDSGFDTEAYRQALWQKSRELSQLGIPLFTIQLANEATARDTEIMEEWQPLWQAVSEAVYPGRFYIASDPSSLTPIYRDIVLSLSGRQSSGIVVETAVSDIFRSTLEIPAGLEQLVFVVQKGNSQQQIEFVMPDGGQAKVRQIAPETSSTELWLVEKPMPGAWGIEIAGEGQIVIWQDYWRSSVPTVVPMNSPTPSATLSPTPLPIVIAAAPTAVAPPGLPTSPPAAPTELFLVPAPTSNENGRSPFIWLIPLILLAAVFSALFLYSQQRQKPIVIGVLHLLGGGKPPIDLAQLRLGVLTIGKPPADIPLAEAAATATIRPGLLIGDIYEMRVDGDEPLRLNGIGVRGETTLEDAAVLDFGGGVTAKYENLLLRRAVREAEQISFLEAKRYE